MELSKTQLSALTLAGFAIALSLIIAFAPVADRERGLWESVSYNLEVSHIRDGEVIWRERSHNLLVDNGLNFTRDKISGTSFNNASRAIHIALSNNGDAIAAGNVSITAEYTTCGLTRAAGTYTETGTGTWNVTHTFTDSCSGTTQVQKSGLFSNSTSNISGHLVAADLFTQRDMEQNDQIQIVWNGTIAVG